MRSFTKPILVVSKCITFEPVRWDGQIIASDFVEKLKPHVDFIPICPEVEIGLGIPRDTLRVVLSEGAYHLIQPSTGLDFTEKMGEFAARFLGSLGEVDGFILKNGSPSSGFKNVKIYPKAERSASVGRGAGFFGKAVLDRFPGLAVEDERRLLNPRIREHFLIKLFALSSFRTVKASGLMKELVRFQSENKLLLTAYSQKELRVMGKLAANQEKRPFAEIIEEYENHLLKAFMRPPTVGSNVNIMLKAQGYFSGKLTGDERAFLLHSLEKYRAGGLPLSACASIVKAWIIRFKEQYLMSQTVFEPYPEELLETATHAGEDGDKDYWK